MEIVTLRNIFIDIKENSGIKNIKFLILQCKTLKIKLFKKIIVKFQQLVFLSYKVNKGKKLISEILNPR